MAKKYSHKVKAALIVVKVPGAQGGEVYLRHGRVLPGTVTADEIKRLTGLGLIEKFEVEGEPEGDTGGNDDNGGSGGAPAGTTK